MFPFWSAFTAWLFPGGSPGGLCPPASLPELPLSAMPRGSASVPHFLLPETHGFFLGFPLLSGSAFSRSSEKRVHDSGLPEVHCLKVFILLSHRGFKVEVSRLEITSQIAMTPVDIRRLVLLLESPGLFSFPVLGM